MVPGLSLRDPRDDKSPAARPLIHLHFNPVFPSMLIRTIILRIALLAGAGALTYAIFWAMGADPRGLAVVLEEMIKSPWTVVTLVDLYLGFLIIAVIIAVSERHWAWAVFWALPVFFLGNVWAAIWLVVRLSRFCAARLNGPAANET